MRCVLCTWNPNLHFSCRSQVSQLYWSLHYLVSVNHLDSEHKWLGRLVFRRSVSACCCVLGDKFFTSSFSYFLIFSLCFTGLAGRRSWMGESPWSSPPCTPPSSPQPCSLSGPRKPPSTWRPPAHCWVCRRRRCGATRRLRGDMRSCPQWFVPCVASLELSTASLVSNSIKNTSGTDYSHLTYFHISKCTK